MVPDDTKDEKPGWWKKNEDLKSELGLPPYEPPRFHDGSHKYKIIDDLEAELECEVQILGIDPQYPDTWEVRVDGRPLFSIGRVRDEQGNTVYQMSAQEFRETLKSELPDED